MNESKQECLVHECPNCSDAGTMIGDLCAPCHEMLTRGKIPIIGTTFLHKMKKHEADGWAEATIAWAVCASLHREYAKGRDPFFKIRQEDFKKHEEEARSELLALEAAAQHNIKR